MPSQDGFDVYLFNFIQVHHQPVFKTPLLHSDCHCWLVETQCNLCYTKNKTFRCLAKETFHHFETKNFTILQKFQHWLPSSKTPQLIGTNMISKTNT
jgi:hypothetical protein